METKVTADQIVPMPGVVIPVVRVQQGTDGLIIKCDTDVCAANNAVILQMMFDKAKLSPA